MYYIQCDLFSVGDIVDCYVDDISLEKNKVSLSLLLDWYLIIIIV